MVCILSYRYSSKIMFYQSSSLKVNQKKLLSFFFYDKLNLKQFFKLIFHVFLIYKFISILSPIFILQFSKYSDLFDISIFFFFYFSSQFCFDSS